MGAPELTIAVEERNGNMVVSVVGDVDLVTSTQLKRALDRVLDRTPAPARITADLAGVGFIDTTGVAVLLTARARAADAGSRSWCRGRHHPSRGCSRSSGSAGC